MSISAARISSASIPRAIERSSSHRSSLASPRGPEVRPCHDTSADISQPHGIALRSTSAEAPAWLWEGSVRQHGLRCPYGTAQCLSDGATLVALGRTGKSAFAVLQRRNSHPALDFGRVTLCARRDRNLVAISTIATNC